MRILMLSWEYPPKAVGGIAQHVYDLTAALAKAGEEVYLLTCGERGIPEYERINGVHVYRAIPYKISAPDFVNWIAQLNIALLEKIIPVMIKQEKPNIIHAHDWLVAYVARVIKYAYHLPLITTIHATEYGRNYGLHNDMQRHISDIEWWLCYESWRVICCSQYMKNEIRYIFQVPEDKIRIIVNGVDLANFQKKQLKVKREQFAAPDEQIVFCVGRLVREKGVQVLLDAVPQILARCPKTKFIIAGKGPYENILRQQAVQMGIAHRVYFTGYVDDGVRNSLYSWADVAVFPSLYEPFGIVALEGMAAKTPVVVSDTGGLSEIVRHSIDGLKAYPGNSQSLTDMIVHLLQNDNWRAKLCQEAYQKVQKEFNWQNIARQTKEVYREVWKAYRHPLLNNNDVSQEKIFNRVTRIFARA